MAKDSIRDVFRGKISMDGLSEGAANELYLPVLEAEFRGAISALDEQEFSLSCLFACENFRKNGFTLVYIFEKKDYEQALVLMRPVAEEGNKPPSIAETFPSACWFEREITDGFGIEFEGAFDRRRLFLHDRYSDNFHPLRKSFKNGKIAMKKSVSPKDEYKFKEVKGEGVYHIPVGPVHAGIIEPGHFRFSVIGETIFNLEARMFWKHRGVEKLAEGKSPDECIGIAESVSGDETVANAVCFSRAIEKISKIQVPSRAWYLRTVFLEMERIYSHLGDMAGMIIDVAYPVGASPFFILREEIFRQNESLTGSRFMKGIIGIGGLKKDVSGNSLEALSSYLGSFSRRIAEAADNVRATPSVVDRLETTGVIRKDLLRALNITGPAARASGSSSDTRLSHPYGIYHKIVPGVKTLDAGDVLSRFEVKYAEILDSVGIIKKIINKIHSGEVSSEAKISDGYALSLVEAARGENLAWVHVKNGAVERYKVRTASFCNWQAIEHAVLGNIVPDFPLINKSLNLSYAGTDL